MEHHAMTGQLGVIYLLCFTRPYRHARHYVGTGPMTCSTGSTLTPAATARD
jgi:hypothetical protein